MKGNMCCTTLKIAVLIAVSSATAGAATNSANKPPVGQTSPSQTAGATSPDVSSGGHVQIAATLMSHAVAPNPSAAGVKVKFTFNLGVNPDGCSAHLSHSDGSPGETILFKKNVTSISYEKTFKAIGTYTESMKGMATQTDAGGLITNWAACKGSQDAVASVVAGR